MGPRIAILMLWACAPKLTSIAAAAARTQRAMVGLLFPLKLHSIRILGPSMSARIELNHKIHVLTKKEELDSVRIPGKVVIVLDVLFATTTMITALAHGAREVVPVLDEAAARAQAGAFRAGEFVI